jgi:hypothetical protein
MYNDYPQARLPEWVQFDEEDDQQPNVSPFVDALKKRMSAGSAGPKAGVSIGSEGKAMGTGIWAAGGGAMKSL